MSDAVLSPKAPEFRPGTSDAEIEAAVAKAARSRRAWVLFWRLVLLVALLGLWEVAVRLEWMTDLALGMPSTVVVRVSRSRVGLIGWNTPNWSNGVRSLTRVVTPDVMSCTKASVRALVSAGTRLVASDSNATRLPSALMVGP